MVPQGQLPRLAPDHSRRNLALLVGGGVVGVIVVIALAALLIVRVSAPSSAPGPAEAEAPKPVAQTATDCTHSVSSGEVPTNGMVSAGGLYFPQNIAPGWRPKAEHRVPNSIDAVSLDEVISDMKDMNWIGQVTVGITNFDQSMSLPDQARLMLKCIVASSLYEGANAVVGTVTTTPGHLDGMPTLRLDASISVSIADPAIHGDDLVLIIVGTSPTTYFLGSAPFGDTARRDVVQAALNGLHVASV